MNHGNRLFKSSAAGTNGGEAYAAILALELILSHQLHLARIAQVLLLEFLCIIKNDSNLSLFKYTRYQILYRLL